ncbi:MAG: hypothetical protein CBD95_000660 [Flavobacteriales bacterium TMED235]|nr:MAG: hypothetical protein CBD95_000660 [Flavobacteriales bacterium TMED235]|tara:strand:+ start:21898 stop:22425 length:528 start_codon:yes stop_codon:yes gene_type:complete
MKKILILTTFILFSCAEKKVEPTSTITVNDDKGKMVSLMMKSYVDNNFDASIVSDDASIKFNQQEMTKDEFENLGNIHHAMFSNISFPDGWIETVNYIGSDIKNAGGRYKESYGEVWTSQWSDWSGVSKITGDTLSNPSFFGYKWKENKIVEIQAIFSDDAFNKEFALYLDANKN